MRKIVLIIVMLFVLNSCGEDPITRIFKLKSVKNVEFTVSDDEIKSLEDKAVKYESVIDEKIEASGNLIEIYESLGIKYLYKGDWNSAIVSLEKSISHGNVKD